MSSGTIRLRTVFRRWAPTRCAGTPHGPLGLGQDQRSRAAPGVAYPRRPGSETGAGDVDRRKPRDGRRRDSLRSRSPGNGGPRWPAAGQLSRATRPTGASGGAVFDVSSRVPPGAAADRCGRRSPVRAQTRRRRMGPPAPAWPGSARASCGRRHGGWTSRLWTGFSLIPARMDQLQVPRCRQRHEQQDGHRHGHQAPPRRDGGCHVRHRSFLAADGRVPAAGRQFMLLEVGIGGNDRGLPAPRQARRRCRASRARSGRGRRRRVPRPPRHRRWPES